MFLINLSSFKFGASNFSQTVSKTLTA